MSDDLYLAVHDHPDAYWTGPNYELNLSFDTLRDRQWQRLTDVIWSQPVLAGPFTERYVPGREPQAEAIIVPEPTDARSQYAALWLGENAIGGRVLLTRSLFECATIQVPLSMFAGIAPDIPEDRLTLPPLDAIYQQMALIVYQAVPFEIANVGCECGCPVLLELLSDSVLRDAVLARGNLIARDRALVMLGQPPENFQAVAPGLRWIPPAG